MREGDSEGSPVVLEDLVETLGELSEQKSYLGVLGQRGVVAFDRRLVEPETILDLFLAEHGHSFFGTTLKIISLGLKDSGWRFSSSP